MILVSVPTTLTSWLNWSCWVPINWYCDGNPIADAINIESPVPTITGKPGLYLVEPYLIEYYGNGNARTIEEPIPTIPTHDRFALIQPGFMIDGREYRLEILYRMLKPRELASAMGFPPEYQFMGNQQDQVKQIGNAVAVNMAKSLISSLIMPQKEVLK